jgi:hypothetical protein
VRGKQVGNEEVEMVHVKEFNRTDWIHGS